jgi:hypothetical protein
MNKTKLISIASLAMALVTMMAPDLISTYASPTTEDDGWTEGDYEGSSEEQEELGDLERMMMMIITMMIITMTMVQIRTVIKSVRIIEEPVTTD